MMISNEAEVRKFLIKYPNPQVVGDQAIKYGDVFCFKPLIGLSGAELWCSIELVSVLREIICDVV